MVDSVQMIGLLVLVVLIGGGAVTSPRPVTAQRAGLSSSAPELRIIRSDQTGVVLELTTPTYTVQTHQSQHEGTPFDLWNQRLVVPGTETTVEPGKPQVPMVSTLLGVPPDAHITTQVIAADSVVLAEQVSLAPAPRPAPATERLQPGTLTPHIDALTYAQPTWYPPAPARIADDAWLRDQRIVRVELFPFQYQPASQHVTWHQRLLIEVAFQQSATHSMPHQNHTSALSSTMTEHKSPFEPILRQRLLNYSNAAHWRSAAHPVTQGQTRARLALDSSNGTVYKITLEEEGLYRLTYDDLAAVGINMDTLDPRHLRLTHRGSNVAVLVTGEEDGRFDQGDAVLFYGQAFQGSVMDKKYTDENVYWLLVDDTTGPRMTTVDGTPNDTDPTPTSYRTTTRAERSVEWWTTHFTSQDTWFWERIDTGATRSVSRTYSIALSAIATEAVSATVRGEVVASSYDTDSRTEHHTIFTLNEQPEPVEDARWDGIWEGSHGPSRHRFEGTVAHTALREGSNQLVFTIINESSLPSVRMYFDWFEVEYQRQFTASENQLVFPGAGNGQWQYNLNGFSHPTVRVFDVTQPLTPVQVLNPRTTLSDDSYQTSFVADQAADARYLAVSQVGLRSPKAIRAYEPPDLLATTNGADYLIITHHQFANDVQRLADYRATQGLRVAVVDVDDLYNLFNDGIYNPVAIKNFLAYAYANWQSPAPAFALLVGDGHWNFKGFAEVVYGNEPIFMPPNLQWVDPWQGEVDSTNLLAAIVGDDILPDLAIGRLPVNTSTELNAAIDKIIAYEATEPAAWQQRLLFVADQPDEAGDFVQLTEDVIDDHMPAGFQADRVYLNTYCAGEVNQTCAQGATRELIQTLNTTGTLFLNYNGHGFPLSWGRNIFSVEDIASLDNGDRLPIVIPMTCLEGYWNYPNRTSMAEELIRAEGVGAVASYSPTGLGVASGHDALQRGFYDAVFQEQVAVLGQATAAGQMALFATGRNLDLISTYAIIGDPALRLPTAGEPVQDERVYLPFIRN